MTEEQKNNHGYGEDSIDELVNEETVRKRPSVMLGTKDHKGAFHAFGEIISNIVDEKNSGFGNKAKVHVSEDGVITVSDEARGVPMGYNKRLSKFNWHLVYNQLYAGGKYGKDKLNKKRQEISKVVFTIGLNGLGASACQFTSEFFKVVSRRQEGTYTKEFKKGVPVNATEVELENSLKFLQSNIEELEAQIEGTEDILVKAELIQKLDYLKTQAPIIDTTPNPVGTTGTTITWKPDIDVFSSIDFTNVMFETYLEAQAYISGITIEYRNDKYGVSKIFEGDGLSGLFESKLDGVDITKTITHETDVIEQFIQKEDIYRYYKAEVIVALTEYTNSSVSIHYHNTGAMLSTESSVHHNATRSAITDFFKVVAKENKIKINATTYTPYISVATSTYDTETSFANQTKDVISNDNIYALIYNTVTDMLQREKAKGVGAVNDFIDTVVREAQLLKEISEMEKNTRDIKVTNRKGAKMEKPEKYWDPKIYGKDSEIWIVEGDSAAQATVSARDNVYQAVMALKGKPVNVLKKPLDMIFANKEIKDLINILGAGVDIQGVGVKSFDINKLRFGKIIILTDADEDGNQIRVLVYLIFFLLFPEIIKQGLLYIGESPLFTNKIGEDDYRYAYTADEQVELIAELKEQNIRVIESKRSKGLGSNNKEQMSESTLHKDTRRLTQVKFDVQDPVIFTITNQIFGDSNSDARKEFVRVLVADEIKETKRLGEIQKLVEEVKEANE